MRSSQGQGLAVRVQSHAGKNGNGTTTVWQVATGLVEFKLGKPLASGEVPHTASGEGRRRQDPGIRAQDPAPTGLSMKLFAQRLKSGCIPPENGTALSDNPEDFSIGTEGHLGNTFTLGQR